MNFKEREKGRGSSNPKMLQTSFMEAAPDSTGEVADEITPLDEEGRKEG